MEDARSNNAQVCFHTNHVGLSLENCCESNEKFGRLLWTPFKSFFVFNVNESLVLFFAALRHTLPGLHFYISMYQWSRNYVQAAKSSRKIQLFAQSPQIYTIPAYCSVIPAYCGVNRHTQQLTLQLNGLVTQTFFTEWKIIEFTSVTSDVATYYISCRVATCSTEERSKCIHKLVQIRSKFTIFLALDYNIYITTDR